MAAKGVSRKSRASGKARLAKAAKSNAARASSKRTVKAHGASAVARPGTKMEKAVTIMEDLFAKKHKPRRDCMAALMEDAKLTKAGAGTYYQLIRARMLKQEAA